MRVLQVNKYFFPNAGSETAFLHTRDLLRQHGHRVIDFSMRDSRNLPSDYFSFFAAGRSYDKHHSQAKRLWDGANSVYSWQARRALGRLLDVESPDVAHLHSISHQLTLSIVDELHERKIPIVYTCHDYKLACPAYSLFTKGAPCRRCIDGNVLNAVRHRCVHGSAPASGLAAIEATLAHRRRTYHRISLFLAPSRFAGWAATAAGIPEEKVRYLPYFLPESELAGVQGPPERPPTFFFGGRLADGKGVRQMLHAFEQVPAPVRLRIAGWGPLEPAVLEAAARNQRVEFLGAISRPDVLRELGESRAMLLPSVLEDNCPLVMLEAQARGTPVIASNRGGPPQFVRDGVDGFLVDPEDSNAFARRIRTLAQDGALASQLGANGRARLLAEHRQDAHHEQLLALYEEARGRAAHR